ncbi:MAG: tRNA-binding protein [Minwuia sp.]|uniref:tRNA-binding protein n=1 Tax=Minwuia sp. TaxID=2493630 RepID=UPI003A858D36
MSDLTYEEFQRVEIRVGTIVDVEAFPEARRPAWKLWIDFGEEIGTRKTSAQITNYAREELMGRQVAAVVNFPKKQIGKFMSECLTLGFPNGEGEVILIGPDKAVPNGGRLF